jgi:hypothetical protein
MCTSCRLYAPTNGTRRSYTTVMQAIGELNGRYAHHRQIVVTTKKECCTSKAWIRLIGNKACEIKCDQARSSEMQLSARASKLKVVDKVTKARQGHRKLGLLGTHTAHVPFAFVAGTRCRTLCGGPSGAKQRWSEGWGRALVRGVGHSLGHSLGRDPAPAAAPGAMVPG